MAIRIQLRRDTAANWTSTNPVLRAGEFGIETDTLKFKIGNGSSTWTQITNYANVTSSGLTTSLNDYILEADLGNPSGPAKLNASGDLLVPENSIILWDDVDYTYNTTVSATQPTANRTITLPDATGTVALTANIPSTTDSLSQGSTNKYFSDELAQDAVATALAAGTHTNMTVSYNDASNAISLAAAAGYTNEEAVDAVATALAAGTHTNISVGYNDAGNAISLTGAVTYTDENAQDAIGNAVGTGLSYNDTTGAISVDTTAIQAKVANVDDTEIGYLNGVTSGIQTQLDTKLASSTAATTYAPIASPTFTGTVSGVTATHVGLGNVNNTSDANKPVSTATQTALDLKAPLASPTFTGTVAAASLTLSGDLTVNGTTTTLNSTTISVDDKNIELGSVATPSDATADGGGITLKGATDKTFNWVDATDAWTSSEHVNLASGKSLYLNGTLLKDATETLTNKTLTSPVINTPTGITKSDVGLANVDNTTDAGKPVSTATQTALDLKAPLANPTFTGTVAGITKTMVGLGSVDNTTDAAKPISTATQTALDLKLASATAATTYETITNVALKAPIASPTFTGTVAGITSTMVGLGNVDNTSDANKPVSTATQTALDLKVDESLFDAKGDLLVASADNTPAKLTVGTNGYLLTANSAATNGVEWAAAPVSLPSQTGNSGYYLTTNGTVASWGALVVPITTGTSTVSANTATTIDTTALSAFTSIEYMVSLKQGSKIRTSKVVVQTDGTSVDMTEFAITETGGTIAGVVVSVAVASTNAVLQLTATDAATTNVTVKFSKVAL